MVDGEKEHLSGEKESLQKEVEQKDTKITTVEQEKQKAIDTRVQELTTSLTAEKTACDQESAAKNANVTAVQANYDEFVKNMAKSVCCKVKVDNPNIAAYEVSGNKLVCLESGANALNC